jgi:hypothetical protein
VITCQLDLLQSGADSLAQLGAEKMFIKQMLECNLLQQTTRTHHQSEVSRNASGSDTQYELVLIQ